MEMLPCEFNITVGGQYMVATRLRLIVIVEVTTVCAAALNLVEHS